LDAADKNSSPSSKLMTVYDENGVGEIRGVRVFTLFGVRFIGAAIRLYA